MTVTDQPVEVEPTTGSATFACGPPPEQATHSFLVRGAPVWTQTATEPYIAGYVACPHSPGRVINTTTGQVLTTSCQNVSCPTCGIFRAFRMIYAVVRSLPTFWIGLTHVAASAFSVTRTRITKFTEKLRAHTPLSWWWVIEPNPSDDGQAHIHALARADTSLNEDTLARTAAAAGLGAKVSIMHVSGPTMAHDKAGYALKSVVMPKVGSKTSARNLRTHIDTNGGKSLSHQSDGFFLDDNGAPITLREALYPPSSNDDWIFVPKKKNAP